MDTDTDHRVHSTTVGRTTVLRDLSPPRTDHEEERSLETPDVLDNGTGRSTIVSVSFTTQTLGVSPQG